MAQIIHDNSRKKIILNKYLPQKRAVLALIISLGQAAPEFFSWVPGGSSISISWAPSLF